jgi:anti-anti-sigma factor
MGEAKMDKKAQITVTTKGTSTEITCEGVWDLYNADEFDAALKPASLTAEDVVVDLRTAVFIDTAIIAYIATASNRMIARGKRLRALLSKDTHPLRTLQIAGFSALIDMEVDEGSER